MITPTAGLANRLRAFASGVYIGNKLNKTILIKWFKTNECYASFEDLFMPILKDSIEINSYKGHSKLSYLPPTKKNFYIPYVIRKFFYSKEINNFNIKIDGNIFQYLPKKGNIYLSSCHSMAKHYPLKKLFVPTLEIQELIKSVTKKFSTNVIGIHIRRTDNIKAIQKNTINDFIKKMDTEIKKNPSTKFYLATDSENTKKELSNYFGNRIISFNTVLNRNTTDGMKGAVVDLWCLSSTKYIIGSYYSSYSELAAELGNIDLVII